MGLCHTVFVNQIIRMIRIMICVQITHLREKCIMGWLRLVGSLKVQVSFAKEPYKRDNILQKKRII